MIATNVIPYAHTTETGVISLLSMIILLHTTKTILIDWVTQCVIASHFSNISWWEQVNLLWYKDACFVLYQHVDPDF